MDLSKDVQTYIQQLKPVAFNDATLKKMISLVDLTSLRETDTESSIAMFIEKARTSFGDVAGLCVYPQFVRLVADEFANTPIKAVTVANFPQGTTSLEEVLVEINTALENGAQELDIVFPYRQYLAGERQYTKDFIEACKAACGKKVILKIILETGALEDLSLIADAARDALVAGADFIKTSTSKLAIGATLASAAAILLTIREINPSLQRVVGIKVSGGIKEIEQACQYIVLADHIMGENWVNPHTFRIGASTLVDELLKVSV